MPSALLPGASSSTGLSTSSPSPLRRVTVFLKRKPLVSVALAFTLIFFGYGLSSPAAAASNLTPSNWYRPSQSDAYTGSAASAIDRARCEELWKQDGRPLAGSGGALPIKPETGVGRAGGGWSDEGRHGWETVNGGGVSFSLEDEVRKGRERKEVLREMVGKTKGFYVRDYPLWLGWNNIRYIIEASLLHAELLDRTLVVPTFVYARACEFDKYTCQAFAKMVNRGDALDSNEWRHEPYEKQWAWLIPIELMIDISLIRRTRPIMTVADYLLLQGLPADRETSQGFWDRTNYHKDSKPSLHVIPNEDYDTGISRVNKMPLDWHSVSETAKTTGLGKKIREVMTENAVEDWGTIKGRVGSGETDVQLEKKLAAAGAYTLLTWQGSGGMEYVRTVTEPIKQVSLGERMKGWWDDYKDISEEVLLLEGETHYQRKPGSLRFTSEVARQNFARMTLFSIAPPSMLQAMAVRLDKRMHDRVGGRMWASAHMRRGDFIHHSWVMNTDAYEHFDRIKGWMEKGQKILRDIKASGKIQQYPVPDVVPTRDFELFEAPKAEDPFYIATDERNVTVIEHMKQNGAIFISDLLTAEDRRELDAWPLVFTDVLGVLEQTLLARSSFFYGHALSSVAGGAVNHRATLGKDPRTTKID